MSHAANTRRCVHATSALLLALAVTATQAAATPYPDAADVVSAYMTLRAWVDDFDLPAPDDPAATVAIGDASGVCVILRRGGRVIGTGTDAAGDGLMLRRAAGRAMGEVLGNPAVGALPAERVASTGRVLTVQLEVAGAPVPLIGTTFADIAAQLNPGLDGVAIRRGERFVMLFPARVRANNTAGRLERLLPALAGDVGLAVMPLPDLARRFDVSMYRFRTTDLAQATPDGPPFETIRGDVLVRDESVTRASIAAFARAVADRLATGSISVGGEDAPVPIGLLGTYRPAADRYEPLIAPPQEQALAAWALARYGRLPELDAHAAARVHAVARRILDELATVTPAEIDPLLSAATCAAIVHAALEHPTYLSGDEPPRLFLEAAERVRDAWTEQDGFIDVDGQSPAPPHACALIASAMSRLLAAGRTGVDDTTARQALDAAWGSVPPHRQVALLPWIGWGEADYALATGRPIATEQLRRLRELLDTSRLDEGTDPDNPDLAGGFDLSPQRRGLATSQTLRPAAMLAWMVRNPDLTPPAETPVALGRMLLTMRFVMQLAVRDPLLWSCPDPARARGGVRQATWDWDQPLPAQALALVTATEMLRSLHD